MARILFCRSAGVAYVVDTQKDLQNVQASLARTQPHLSFEEVLIPLGGAIRVRAVEEGHLDLTTSLTRGNLL